MNINEAKQIPLNVIVEKIGGRLSHTDRHGDMWYFSPFRPDEGTASFKINIKNNTWHDFGMSGNTQGSGGDALDLWCDYNFKDRRTGVKEALQAFSSYWAGAEIRLEPRKEKVQAKTKLKPRYEILKIGHSITHFGLKDELTRRKVSVQLANLYLKQGHILDIETNRKYYAFLFENDKGGYEVSIPNPKRGQCFKTCIGSKASTRIISVENNADGAEVFEGFWDFLSWLETNGLQYPINHSYVLNSVSMVNEVCDKIMAFKDNVQHVFLFMDNDNAGFLATHAIALKCKEAGLQAVSMESFYKGHKDVSEARMNNALTSNPLY